MEKLPSTDEETMLIVDLTAIIHMVCTDKLDCGTFGDLSDILLRLVLSAGRKFTAVVDDCYTAESIKWGETSRRGQVKMTEIRNPRRNKPLPQQKGKMLSNPAYKFNLMKFLFEDWISNFQNRAGNHFYY